MSMEERSVRSSVRSRRYNKEGNLFRLFRKE